MSSQEPDSQVVEREYTFWFAQSPGMDQAQATLQLMRGLAQLLDADHAVQVGEPYFGQATQVVPMTWVDDQGNAHIVQNITMHIAKAQGVILKDDPKLVVIET